MVDMNDLIDYYANQPEVQGFCNESELDKVKELFAMFEMDESKNTTKNEQFNEYLNTKVIEVFGAGIDVFMQDNTRSSQDLKSIFGEEPFEYMNSVYRASSQFWSEYDAHSTRGSIEDASVALGGIAADLAGYAWGSHTGNPHIAAIASAAASAALAQTVEAAGYHYDWKCNPKYI